MKSRRGKSKGVRSDARGGRKWRAVMSINIFCAIIMCGKRAGLVGKKCALGVNFEKSPHAVEKI